MNLISLAFANIQKSIKDFTIYFATLILGVCVFYVFNGLNDISNQLVLSNPQRMMVQMMDSVMGYISVFVAVVLGFLVIYATRFLMKRRKKEFGLYLLLGMSKQHVSMVLVFETLIIGLISLVLGIFLGVIVSQFMSLIIAGMFKADVKNYTFNFSMDSALKTLLYFAIIYAVVMLFNTIVITKCKLIDLINASKKGEVIPNKNPLISILFFIVAVVMLGYAYHLVDPTANLPRAEVIGIAMGLGFVGTILLVYAFSGLMMVVLAMNKKFYYHNLNYFVIRQLRCKFNTTVISMSLIAVMLFFTIGILSNGLAIASNLNHDLETYNTADFTLMRTGNQSQDFKQYLSKSGFDLETDLSRYADYRTYTISGVDLDTVFKDNDPHNKQYVQGYQRTLIVMKLSEYNKAAKILKAPQFTLDDNQLIIGATYQESSDTLNQLLNKTTNIKLGNINLKAKYQKVQPAFYEIAAGPYNEGVFIIPDAASKNLKLEPYNDYISGYYASGIKASTYEKQLNQVLTNGPDGSYRAIYRDEIILSGAGAGTIVTFIGIYLGTIFLITSAAILALKQLSETSDDKNSYRLLRFIGTDEKMINHALLAQVICFFFFPVVIALIHIIGVNPFTKSVVRMLGTSHDITLPSLVTAFIILVIYGGYFLITYIYSKKLINEA